MQGPRDQAPPSLTVSTSHGRSMPFESQGGFGEGSRFVSGVIPVQLVPINFQTLYSCWQFGSPLGLLGPPLGDGNPGIKPLLQLFVVGVPVRRIEKLVHHGGITEVQINHVLVLLQEVVWDELQVLWGYG
eukprot:FR742270.1.p3 GENE.FR742270.1~~FR742270.1.p3  ORF type:complete len:130 (+),score=17.88 FR742270.1:114-503(+)